jgi:flagellar secretion chaperone FliS
MYGRLSPLRARNQYRALELTSRVEGASPHALVAILYEELLRSLDVLGAALRQGQDIGRDPHSERARSIITTLSASLDFDQGAAIANTLAGVYRAMAVQLSTATANGDAAKLSELRDGVATIAASWARLAA